MAKSTPWAKFISIFLYLYKPESPWEAYFDHGLWMAHRVGEEHCSSNNDEANWSNSEQSHPHWSHTICLHHFDIIPGWTCPKSKINGGKYILLVEKLTSWRIFCVVSCKYLVKMLLVNSNDAFVGTTITLLVNSIESSAVASIHSLRTIFNGTQLTISNKSSLGSGLDWAVIRINFIDWLFQNNLQMMAIYFIRMSEWYEIWCHLLVRKCVIDEI